LLLESEQPVSSITVISKNRDELFSIIN